MLDTELESLQQLIARADEQIARYRRFCVGEHREVEETYPLGL